jgi:hypothetical protein
MEARVVLFGLGRQRHHKKTEGPGTEKVTEY